MQVAARAASTKGSIHETSRIMVKAVNAQPCFRMDLPMGHDIRQLLLNYLKDLVSPRRTADGKLVQPIGR